MHDISRTIEDRDKFAASIGTTTDDLGDLEWPLHASHAISAVAELLVCCSLVAVRFGLLV